MLTALTQSICCIALCSFLILSLPTSAACNTESICFGTTSHGKLTDGIKLPRTGKNFSAYSDLGWLIGRTYLHSKVRTVVLDAYKAMEETLPETTFVYGETGWKSGGSFKPHKTHQNGLSVDFMVPVVDDKGKSVPFPSSLTNKLGYDIEFNKNSQYQQLRIDYHAFAEHLYWLHKMAVKNKIKIWRVIFDPRLQHNLKKTTRWPYLKQHIQFSKRPSWVRHDEHYHVDFILKCQPLANKP